MGLMKGLSAASSFPARFLNWRARNRAVGTEHAAITLLRPQERPAAGAVIEELARISRHCLQLRRPAQRTGDGGFSNHNNSFLQG